MLRNSYAFKTDSAPWSWLVSWDEVDPYYRIILQHPVMRVKASILVRIRIMVVCVRGSCSFVVGY